MKDVVLADKVGAGDSMQRWTVQIDCSRRKKGSILLDHECSKHRHTRIGAAAASHSLRLLDASTL